MGAVRRVATLLAAGVREDARTVASRLRGLTKRCLLALVHVNDPWISDEVLNLHRPALRRMIARARLDRRREAGAMVCWTYRRDRVAEQRELRLESELQKRKRLIRARLDKGAGRHALRLVV